MESTIKKLHQLQLMAVDSGRVSVSICVISSLEKHTHWTANFNYWFNGDIKDGFTICSSDENADHRIDMMIKHRILEK